MERHPIEPVVSRDGTKPCCRVCGRVISRRGPWSPSGRYWVHTRWTTLV